MAGMIGKLRSKLPKVESMHTLSERDRAKKDYGKVELKTTERRMFAENAGHACVPKRFCRASYMSSDAERKSARIFSCTHGIYFAL